MTPAAARRGFKPGDCGTQCNLSEEGRQQAQRTVMGLSGRHPDQFFFAAEHVPMLLKQIQPS